MRLSAPKAKKIARSASESGGVCRARTLGARPWPFSPPSEQTKPPLCRATGCFLGLRVAFTECPSSRVPEVVIDVDDHQPKPAQPHPRSSLIYSNRPNRPFPVCRHPLPIGQSDQPPIGCLFFFARLVSGSLICAYSEGMWFDFARGAQLWAGV